LPCPAGWWAPIAEPMGGNVGSANAITKATYAGGLRDDTSRPLSNDHLVARRRRQTLLTLLDVFVGVLIGVLINLATPGQLPRWTQNPWLVWAALALLSLIAVTIQISASRTHKASPGPERSRREDEAWRYPGKARGEPETRPDDGTQALLILLAFEVGLLILIAATLGLAVLLLAVVIVAAILIAILRLLTDDGERQRLTEIGMFIGVGILFLIGGFFLIWFLIYLIKNFLDPHTGFPPWPDCC